MDTISFPTALILGQKVLRVFNCPASFVGPDGVQHPADAWMRNPAELREMIAPWQVVPVVEEAQPDVERHRIGDRTQSVVDDTVVLGWDSTPYSEAEFASRARQSLESAAMAALNKVTSASGTIMRCIAAGQQVPAEWSAYVRTLRAIANGTDKSSAVLPKCPAYPLGS